MVSRRTSYIVPAHFLFDVLMTQHRLSPSMVTIVDIYWVTVNYGFSTGNSVECPCVWRWAVGWSEHGRLVVIMVIIILLIQCTELVLNAPSIITPAHQAHKSFLKPSRLPGEYTVQLLPFLVHIGRIKHNNQLCPHRYPHLLLGWRRSVLLKGIGTTVAIRIQTNILTIRPLEHKSNELNPLAMTLQKND